jgi:hypothetical protein
LEGHASRVFGLMVEKSLNTFVWSCSWDKAIFIWDAQTKRFVAECKEVHKDAVSCLLEVNGTIWSGSWDKSIALWAPQEFSVDLDASSITRLMTALQEKNMATISVLLKELSSEKHSNNPIHFAVKTGNTGMITLLIENESSSLETPNRSSWRPLHIASKFSTLKIIRMLMEKAASASPKTNLGESALHLMLSRSWYVEDSEEVLAVLELLIQNYEEGINETNNQGDTPLHKRKCPSLTFLLSFHFGSAHQYSSFSQLLQSRRPRSATVSLSYCSLRVLRQMRETRQGLPLLTWLIPISVTSWLLFS